MQWRIAHQRIELVHITILLNKLNKSLIVIRDNRLMKVGKLMLISLSLGLYVELSIDHNIVNL
ncbi:hypothetical protein JCM19240_4853 [Vibrio maritimus]|uniref:Uncharacterized protein n=1 Tax=Vibrio maritimus TaxID=990268 RepID=A0A090T9I8_9VIBR|nr:hypothetical protein JCM19240_4853 [Vibrio maritimus]